MFQMNSIEKYQQKINALGADLPHVHVVLGSGFGSALDTLDAKTWKFLGEIRFQDIPGLVASSVADHAGAYRLYQHQESGKIAQFQRGRLHGYEGHEPRAVVQTVMIPRLAGIENFLLTNAAGGLDRAMNPGDIMIIEDHVNLTARNPLMGLNPTDPSGKEIGPRFPDMGNCYRPEWRARLLTHLEAQGLRVHKGIYLGLMGPTFETHAEVRLYAAWGMKAVGMSTVWETISLHHSGAKVAGLSLISNLGAGLGAEPLDHHTIVNTGRASSLQTLQGIAQFLIKDLFHERKV